jgi:hypothetical protein
MTYHHESNRNTKINNNTDDYWGGYGDTNILVLSQWSINWYDFQKLFGIHTMSEICIFYSFLDIFSREICPLQTKTSYKDACLCKVYGK